MTTLTNQLELAVKLARDGEREKARSMFALIVEQSPDETEAWLWLSELSDKLDDQVAALDKAVECIDAVDEAQNNLQDRLNTIRDVISLPPPGTPELKDVLPAESVDHDQEAQNTALQWARRLVVLGEKREAERMLKEQLRDDPTCEEALMLLYELTQPFADKKRLLESVLAKNPEHQDAARQMEWVTMQIEDSKTRRSFLDRITTEPARMIRRRLFSR